MRVFINKRWLLVAPLLVVLGYCLQAGFSLMMADIYHRHVGHYLEHWADAYKKQPDNFSIPLREMNIAQKSAGKAVTHQPDDPVQLLQMAKVLQWQPFLENENTELIDDSPLELDLIRKAVSLRPAWPYSWITLAEAKARYHQIDPEFNNALVQAVILGPWEKEVMEKVARLGKHYQHWLSPESRIAVELSWNNFVTAYPARARKM